MASPGVRRDASTHEEARPRCSPLVLRHLVRRSDDRPGLRAVARARADPRHGRRCADRRRPARDHLDEAPKDGRTTRPSRRATRSRRRSDQRRHSPGDQHRARAGSREGPARSSSSTSLSSPRAARPGGRRERRAAARRRRLEHEVAAHRPAQLARDVQAEAAALVGGLGLRPARTARTAGPDRPPRRPGRGPRSSTADAPRSGLRRRRRPRRRDLDRIGDRSPYFTALSSSAHSTWSSWSTSATASQPADRSSSVERDAVAPSASHARRTRGARARRPRSAVGGRPTRAGSRSGAGGPSATADRTARR